MLLTLRKNTYFSHLLLTLAEQTREHRRKTAYVFFSPNSLLTDKKANISAVVTGCRKNKNSISYKTLLLTLPTKFR